MKKTLFLVVSFSMLSVTIFAQNPGLFDETWYLRSLTLDNETSYAPYQENFNLIFEDDTNQVIISANGVENGFGGTATFNDATDTFQFQEYSITLLDCTVNFCDYEALYFYSFLTDDMGALKEFEYFYYQFSSGLKTIRLTDAFGNVAKYYNNPIEPPSTALFQTYYLHETGADLGPPSYIEDYDPPMQPTITINEDLSFSGIGSCNNFTGQFEYTQDGFNGTFLIPVAFETEGETCQYHNNFEEAYFYHFEQEDPLYFYASENPGTGNAVFQFELSPGFYFLHRNFPVLEVEDFNLEIIRIYPNPTANLLKIKDTNNVVTSYSISDQMGKTILQSQAFIGQEINVASFKSGIYFINVVSEAGSNTLKFIKD
jgi:hypothetical protein